MSMSRRGSDCRREGCVSVWISTFPSMGAAELYFGIPDEIGAQRAAVPCTCARRSDDTDARKATVRHFGRFDRSLEPSR
jgi:hypothetical protein